MRRQTRITKGSETGLGEHRVTCGGRDVGDAIKNSANRKKHLMQTLPKDKKRLEDFNRLRSMGKTDRRKWSSNEQTRRQNAPIIFQEKKSHPPGKSDSWMIWVERWGQSKLEREFSVRWKGLLKSCSYQKINICDRHPHVIQRNFLLA